MREARTPVDPAAVAEDARHWAQPILERLAGGFVSLYLYGSALEPEFDPARSDWNLLLVVRALPASQLRSLAESWPSAPGAAARATVVVLTEQDLARSLDSFALELAEIRDRGRLLAGQDVLANLAVPREALRTHLERELRTLVVRLRRAYLESGRESSHLAGALAAGGATLLACARGAASLQQGPIPVGAEAALAEAARWAGVDARAWLAAWRLRREPTPPTAIETLYLDVLDATETFLGRVDDLAKSAS